MTCKPIIGNPEGTRSGYGFGEGGSKATLTCTQPIPGLVPGGYPYPWHSLPSGPQDPRRADAGHHYRYRRSPNESYDFWRSDKAWYSSVQEPCQGQDLPRDKAMTSVLKTSPTRSVKFTEDAREKEDHELDKLLTQMHSTPVDDPAYLSLHGCCVLRFPTVAQTLPRPEFAQKATFHIQTSALVVPATLAPTTHLAPSYVRDVPHGPRPAPTSIRRPWGTNPNTTTNHSMPSSSFRPRPSSYTMTDSDIATFIRPQMEGCAFCAQLGHLLRECPKTEEYLRTGHTIVFNNCIHLPNGEKIPNDGSNRGLQHGIDIWLVANATNTEAPTTTTIQELPPHTLLCFQEVGRTRKDEDLDIFQVFATERKKAKTRAALANGTTLQDEAVQTELLGELGVKLANKHPYPAVKMSEAAGPPIVDDAPCLAPQYKYQSSLDDQKLTTK